MAEPSCMAGDTAPPVPATAGTGDRDGDDRGENDWGGDNRGEDDWDGDDRAKTDRGGLDDFGPDDGPVVVAFFPGVFSPACTDGLLALQERLDRLRAAGATVVGVSPDTPFSLGAFSDRYGIEFELVSDEAPEALWKPSPDERDDALDRSNVIPDATERAVVVVGEDGTVAYSWVADDPTTEPEYDAILDAVEAVRTG